MITALAAVLAVPTRGLAVDNEDGEIIYTLSGTSTDGEFY